MTEFSAKPAIILVDPQMGENIGAAARAMLNFGLTDLRIVRPRDGWPNERADAMAAGAFAQMPPVQVFDTTAAALADCHYILATTARPRDMVKPVFTPHGAAREMRAREQSGQKTAFLYGAERSGLTNDDIALAQGVITIPVNPEFSSLNLGMAVLLTAYEWNQAGVNLPPRILNTGDAPPAPHDKLMELFSRLEAQLDKGGFFRDEGHRPVMVRNLRNLLLRTDMTEQEARTFHGIITALTRRPQESDGTFSGLES